MLFFTKIVKEAKKKLRCDGVQNIHNGYGGKTATDGTLRRAEEGPYMLHAPPTAHMVDTLGKYKWRHHGDYSISTLNPPNHSKSSEN